MKKYFILTIILILTLGCVFGQTKFDKTKISFKVKLIVRKLNRYDIVSGALIGKVPRKPKQYKIFERLKAKADENELYELTNHPNPTIRAYAFWGLTEINSTKTLNTILKNQSDTAIVVYKYGCTGKSRRVIGFMTKFIPTYAKNNNITLTPEQDALVKRELDIYLNREIKSATEDEKSDD